MKTMRVAEARTGWRFRLPRDPLFYRSLTKLAVPIVLQRIFNAGLFLLDNIMVGRLDETAVAAVNLAGQTSFLLMLFSFGVVSGASIFFAQCWGKGDVAELRRYQGIALRLNACIGVAFALAGFFFSETILKFWSRDPAVVEQGARYLRIVSVGYLFQPITFVYAMCLRNCEKTGIPMVSTFISALVNLLLNTAFIYGKWGAPRMGAAGSAVGTSVALALDCMIITGYSYLRKLPAGAKLAQMRFTRQEFRHFLKIAWPVIFNEIGWALGLIVCAYGYSRLGRAAVAANQMYEVANRFFFSFSIAFGSAGAVMVGKAIGEGEKKRAFLYGRRLLRIAVLLGLLMPLLIWLTSPLLHHTFNVSMEAKKMFRDVILIYAVFYGAEVINFTFVISCLRSGGDTAKSMQLDLAGMWLVSVPLCLAAAYFFRGPLWLCFLGVRVGDIVKVCLLSHRFYGKAWIKSIVDERVAEPRKLALQGN